MFLFGSAVRYPSRLLWLRHPVTPGFHDAGAEMNCRQPLTRCLSAAHTHAQPHLFISHRVPTVLERKMSTRQSREELIKKGVLKEVYDKGEKGEKRREPSAQFAAQ